MAGNAHLPNISSTLVDIHRLLAIFHASEKTAALELEAPIRKLFAGIEGDEITRILLSVAVTVRIVEDRQFPIDGIYSILVGACGTLTPDLAQPASRVPLELREACNKIIHSHRLEPATKLLGTGAVVLNSRIKLYGKKRAGRAEREWEAELDVVEFCKGAAIGLDCLVRFVGERVSAAPGGAPDLHQLAENALPYVDSSC